MKKFIALLIFLVGGFEPIWAVHTSVEIINGVPVICKNGEPYNISGWIAAWNPDSVEEVEFLMDFAKCQGFEVVEIFIPWYMIILPIATFFVPFAFFIKYVMDIHNFVPEAVPFRTARKLRMKGEVGDVIRIVEGNDVVKHGVLKVDVATGKIFYKTKQYGIKINPSEYPSIPSERTPDGVRMFNFAPVQITPVTGSGAVAVDELIKYVRTNHTELNHLSDVALGTLLSKTGKELELDAHLFLDRSKNPTITEPDIVKTVKTIQKTEGAKELVIEPAGRFFVYRKAMEVVNCAYTGAFLQDAILTVKQLTLAKAEKPSYANVLIWVVAIIAVLMGGVVAFKMLGMS